MSLIDISGFGIQLHLIASNTFPIGFTITQFADDADPIDIPSTPIADKGMGVNGDMPTWSKASPSSLTVNVIPGSDDDKNLSILYEANRVSKGKNAARDVITATIIYPDGSFETYKKGIMTDGMPGKGVSSQGRQKTKAYVFAFASQIGA